MRIVIITSLIISFFAALLMGVFTCIKFIGSMQGAEILLIVLGRAIFTFGIFFCVSLILGSILKKHVPQLAYLFIDKEIEYTMPMIVPDQIGKEEEWPTIKAEENLTMQSWKDEEKPYVPEQAEQIALALRTWIVNDEDKTEEI
ncbi:hypothetical protein AUJ95_03965 [Candidatus Desantisbacteria bacterium CG2_30_40_21]|uniref:Uncharacterized protein n=5 Tax=unclassified Candidatus Desantisiibacteriota TaxID=3106372 RepID=A0A2M7JDM2_9BACT|nr:MAG: hypothetical protein AUJ95_03965 [Candidatus Desantisbacteria bacterium CG2_30_40_21]PIP39924.1 MAG: hypothetical protein COX18_08400 [Candidatus Desantisbacteria bacterium CG23_combo_of_CG06-09_8_20_14_all_40_23]PIX17473.1 MAG: hypothetical protein COZ71_03130 [Candidatus Desantisbacteria bacterium CG_4_8_14_3_um_filter_40_12]PIY18633.1 MAG: hypothetical protein COZ13_09575 [Candidatus Desantisbacteria bacterium CG_4_10_14_3_um_filter_40_18]PJB29103.1 MAG: hypothetical protein CO110_07